MLRKILNCLGFKEKKARPDANQYVEQSIDLAFSWFIKHKGTSITDAECFDSLYVISVGILAYAHTYWGEAFCDVAANEVSDKVERVLNSQIMASGKHSQTIGGAPVVGFAEFLINDNDLLAVARKAGIESVAKVKSTNTCVGTIIDIVFQARTKLVYRVFLTEICTNLHKTADSSSWRFPATVSTLSPLSISDKEIEDILANAWMAGGWFIGMREPA